MKLLIEDTTAPPTDEALIKVLPSDGIPVDEALIEVLPPTWLEEWELKMGIRRASKEPRGSKGA